MAYTIYLDNIQLPITPSKVKLKINNQNKTINLINESEVNILKKAGLSEITFEMQIPQIKYPFAIYPDGFKDASFFLNKLEQLKVSQSPFQFICSRSSPSGELFFDTNMTVGLEDYDLSEDSKEGFDVLATIKLKQYRPYSTKIIELGEIKQERPIESAPSAAPMRIHTIVKGDRMWNLAKKYLGKGSRESEIYALNKDVIEAEAKKRGLASSSNGWWIFPGTKLQIPNK